MTWDYYDIKKEVKFVEGQFKDEQEITDSVIEFKKKAMKQLEELYLVPSSLGRAKKLFDEFLDGVKE